MNKLLKIWFGVLIVVLVIGSFFLGLVHASLWPETLSFLPSIGIVALYSVEVLAVVVSIGLIFVIRKRRGIDEIE